MERKIKELSEFAADHEIMIQNMDRRLKLVERVGAIISIVSVSALFIALFGFIFFLVKLGL